MLHTRHVSAGVAAMIIAGVLASCSAAPMPVPAPTGGQTPPPRGDGTLTIGTLFPTSGASSFISAAQTAGVDLAIQEINKAGGVLGEPVVVVHRDSGAAKTTKLETSFASLLEEETDVVIGPSSSVLAERILPEAIDAGVTLISPAATAPRLSGLDDHGLLFRTISSAAMQGEVLAELASAGENAAIAIIYFDDDTGRAMAATVTSTAAGLGGKVVASEKFTASTKSLSSILSTVTESKPDAVILASPFSAMSQNKKLITGLTKEGLGNKKLWLTGGNLADYSQELPAGTLAGARGVIEGAAPDKEFTARVKSVGKKVSDYRYAAEAYDAVMLAALAAIVAGSDDGVAVAHSVRDVSFGGIKCLGFAQCLDALVTTPDIDYDGISGPVDLSAEGDPISAHFGVYQYTKANKFSRVDGVVGG